MPHKSYIISYLSHALAI